MTTQTLGSTEKSTAATSTKNAVGKKAARASRPRESWGSGSPKKKTHGGRASRLSWTVSLRGLVILIDWLLAFITATAVLPALGAWLHQQSGASQGSLTPEGTIAMWGMPLFFLVILLAAGEITVMRGMWRWSTRRLQRINDRADDAGAEPVAETARKKSSNRKKTK
ncbi:hypothetical protein [Streptomyces sp. NPDC007083]|uniref:hypothetical protein n=1 Tax=Streptomyces sp. NPDC007083 TaxID=3156913 RepID=UPI003408BD07